MTVLKKFTQKRLLVYFLLAGGLFLLDFGPFFLPLKNVFTKFFQPVRIEVYQLMRQFSGPRVFYSSKLKDQEERILDLEKELALARGEIAKLEQLYDENKRLRELVSSAVTEKKITYQPAWVIGRQGDYLMINRGEKDGVTVGQMVVNEKHYFVGQVAEVFDQEAKVLVVGSASLELPVLILSAWGKDCFTGISDCQKAKGILSGGIIKDILRDGEIGAGDVVTLLDDHRGILVGEITQVQESKDSIFKQAEIKSLVDLSRLTEVFLIN